MKLEPDKKNLKQEKHSGKHFSHGVFWPMSYLISLMGGASCTVSDLYLIPVLPPAVVPVVSQDATSPRPS